MTYGSALMLIEYMERSHVDVGRTESTLVLVHVWICMCHCLVYGRYTGIQCNMKPSQSSVMQTHICYGIVLAWANRQYVGIGAFECVITWCSIYYDTITIGHSPGIHTQNNGDAPWHTAVRWCSCWLNTYIVYIYAVLALDEQGVRWYALVHVWIWVCHYLVCVRCTVTPSQLHTCLLSNYNGNDVHLCTDANSPAIHTH